MDCKVDGCGRTAMYKAKQLCQKHYFRVMRYGTTELTSVRKYRIQSPAGYQKLYEPLHTLADSCGYVYEHRFIIHKEFGNNLPGCEICGKPLDWKSCHIDHIDTDTTNNKRDNIRPVCVGCNVARSERLKTERFTLGGVLYTATQLSKLPNANFCRSRIRDRIEIGYDVNEAVFGEKKTHNGKVYKAPKKTNAKHERKNAIVVVVNGVTMSAAEACRHPLCGVSDRTLANRIKSGMDHHQAVFSSPKTGIKIKILSAREAV